MMKRRIIASLEETGIGLEFAFGRMLDYALYEIAFPIYEGFREGSVVSALLHDDELSLAEREAYEYAVALVAREVPEKMYDVLGEVRSEIAEVATGNENWREKRLGAARYLEGSANADPRGWLKISASCDEVLALGQQITARGMRREESMIAYLKSCDLTRFKMDYIQLAFAGIPALVTCEKLDLYTPDFFLSGWIEKLAPEAEEESIEDRLKEAMRQLSLFDFL